MCVVVSRQEGQNTDQKEGAVESIQRESYNRNSERTCKNFTIPSTHLVFIWRLNEGGREGQQIKGTVER